MVDYRVVILIGLIGGISVGIQSPMAGAIGQRVGGVAGSLIVHLSGTILSAILLFWRGGENIKDWRTLPWYMLGVGIFGLILYQTINITLPRLGGAMMLTLIIVGQLLVGLLIDQFGWFGVTARPIDATRFIGAVILLVGGYLIAR